MPYTCKLEGSKWKLTKDKDGKVLGTHDTKKSCRKQMRAIYANEMRHPKNIVFENYITMPWNFEDMLANVGDEINLVVDSPGGSYIDAVMIHNKLRGLGKPINTYIRAFALSAGAIVALAGDKIYMVENGVMYFHPPKLVPNGNPIDATELKDLSDFLEKAHTSLVNTLMSRTKKTEDECRKIMQGTYYTPDEALAAGIIDEIIPILRDELEVPNFLPPKIVNFVQEKNRMPVKEICQRFGLNVTDENAEQLLVEYIEKLKSKSDPTPTPTNISPSIINMVKKARETELNALVASGKAIPAVVNELKLSYVTEERIKADIQSESKEFDTVVNALNKNEEVFSFKNKAGTQSLQNPGNGNVEDNILIRDMEKRGKK